MTLLHDAYTALLSGLTTKTGNEINWEDEYGRPITVEPINTVEETYIVRYHYKNSKKQRKVEYKNDKLHGKDIGWWESGVKWWEEEYYEGQRHGKDIGWYENGNKRLEIEYRQDQQHGKSIGWYDNGAKQWETEYENGKLIKRIL